MRQNREFRSSFENISRDCRATFVRVSHDFPTNVALFYYHSYDSRATFVRVSHDICRLVLLSRRIVARCSHVFLILSRDCHTILARHSYECRVNFALNIRHNFAATGSRHSHERRTTVA